MQWFLKSADNNSQRQEQHIPVLRGDWAGFIKPPWGFSSSLSQILLSVILNFQKKPWNSLMWAEPQVVFKTTSDDETVVSWLYSFFNVIWAPQIKSNLHPLHLSGSRYPRRKNIKPKSYVWDTTRGKARRLLFVWTDPLKVQEKD